MTTIDTSAKDLLAELSKSSLSFTCDAAEAKAILASLKRGITNGINTMPILKCVRIVALDGHVKMTTSDLELTVSNFVPSARNVSNGIITVDHAGMTAFLKAVKARDRAELTVMVSQDDVTLRIGGRTTVLRALDHNEYPRLAAVDYSTAYRDYDLSRWADVAVAVSPDEARPILNTLCVGDGEVAATDSYRLATVTAHTLEELGLTAPVLFPKRMVVAALAEAKGRPDPMLAVGDREATLRWTDALGTVLTVRTVEGEFPRYEGLFPTDSDLACAATMHREGLAAALTSLKTFLAKHLNTPARFDFDPDSDTVRIYGVVQDVGTEEHTVSCRYTGPKLTVGFNPVYALGMLDRIDTDTVTLRGVNVQKPWVLIDRSRADGYHRRRLLMPVRMS